MQSAQINAVNNRSARQAKPSRFRIVKLEERIAPTHKAGHYPPGQSGGGYFPDYCHWHGKHRWCKG